MSAPIVPMWPSPMDREAIDLFNLEGATLKQNATVFPGFLSVGHDWTDMLTVIDFYFNAANMDDLSFGEAEITAPDLPSPITSLGRVALGDCSPRAPTDPDVRISRIGLVIL